MHLIWLIKFCVIHSFSKSSPLFSTAIISPMYSNVFMAKKKNYCGKGHAARTHIVTTETGSDFTYAGHHLTEFFQEESSESKSSEIEPCWQNDLMEKGKKMTMSEQCTMAKSHTREKALWNQKDKIQFYNQRQHKQS